MSGIYKPCPFCGSDMTYYEVDGFDRGYVACYSCYAKGPTVEAARGANRKAAKFWNKAQKEKS